MNNSKMGFRDATLQQMRNHSATMSPSPPQSLENAITATSQNITDFSISRILGEKSERISNAKVKSRSTPLPKPTPHSAGANSNSAGILDLSKSATSNENVPSDITYPFYRSAAYTNFFHTDFLAATKFYAHFFPHMFPAAQLATVAPPSFPKRFFAPYIVNSSGHQSAKYTDPYAKASAPIDVVSGQQSKVDCADCRKYPACRSINPPTPDSLPFSTARSPYLSPKSASAFALNTSATISLTAVTNVNLTNSKDLKLNDALEAVSLDSTSPDIAEEISYKCRICDKVFGCSQTLQAHEKTHKSPRYECNDCGKGFSQLRNYKYHLSVHRGTKEFAAECPECGKTFNDKGYLSSHMKIHRNKKEYECPYCPKSFNQRVAFNMHVRIHTGVKPHKCNECGKRFSRKMLLKQHMRTHSGEKPYQCSVCGKSFADRSNMTLHHRLHSGIKPFNCPICPKAFTKKHHLKTHLNYHTGCKPYVCPHPNCNQAFTQSSNMRTHAKKCQFRPLQMSALPLNSPGGQHSMPMATIATTATAATATTATANAVINSSISISNSANLLASHCMPTSGQQVIGSVTPRRMAAPLTANFSAAMRMLNSAANVTSTPTSSSRAIIASKSAFPPTQQPLLSTLYPL